MPLPSIPVYSVAGDIGLDANRSSRWRDPRRATVLVHALHENVVQAFEVQRAGVSIVVGLVPLDAHSPPAAHRDSAARWDIETDAKLPAALADAS